MTIISLHIPKTAGVSFSHALNKAFGMNRILSDYEEGIESDQGQDIRRRLVGKQFVRIHKDEIIQNYDVVHGHFQADKYLSLGKNARFCAFFRDPIERLCSHYFYWLRVPDLKNTQCKDLIELGMSIQEFSHFETQKHFYKRILGRVQIDDFTFIGLTEYYKESIHLFNKIFNLQLEDSDHDNSNHTTTQIDYKAQLKEGGIYEEIKELQEENQWIYDQARKRFELLFNTFSSGS
ncbi:MAG: sulfotransferase family 2 domain-containing protein [Deltaproteobacteria bacterium]|nr:sulfotransferase family 2 domain-containing protein [Deltaproteobacteria bacterium]